MIGEVESIGDILADPICSSTSAASQPEKAIGACKGLKGWGMPTEVFMRFQSLDRAGAVVLVYSVQPRLTTGQILGS